MSRAQMRSWRDRLRGITPMILGIVLVATGIFLAAATNVFMDCEPLTLGTTTCFLYWFQYPLQISLVALGVLLVFSRRFKKFELLLTAMGLGVLLVCLSGLVLFRGSSMSPESGNYPCQILEYGYPLPWLSEIVTCTETGFNLNQLIVPITRFGLDAVIWTTIVGCIFLGLEYRRLGKLTTSLIALTALLGLLTLLVVVGTFS